jgi:hypothetical protein
MRAVRVMAYAVLLVGGLSFTATASASTGTALEAYPPLGLAESSGMTASGAHENVMWVVEDSGEPPDELPVVRAFDPTGAEVASVTLSGWNNRDTEALSMGPRRTLWVADIGDNNAARESVVVHTFQEPVALANITLEPVSYRLRYPEGPRDAEALMVDPVDGRVYVATKSVLGDGSLYVAPASLVADETHDMTLVARVPSWITDGSFTPDGERLVLLRALPSVTTKAILYDVARPGGGAPIQLTQTGEIDLPNQRQSEMLTVTLDGQLLMVGSEGGDEPIWSVPLPRAAQSSERPPESSSVIAEPGATAPSDPDACRLSDPSACLDEPLGWLVAVGVALVALLVTALAVLRRSRD